MGLQSLVRAIYPAQCVSCDASTADDHGLCGPCWRETRFASGAVCRTCSAPLLAETATENLICDDCLRIARPWGKGRAALLYEGVGRKIVLALKHGDRAELAIPAAAWMVNAGHSVLTQDTLIVPVPLHWSRLLKRRYNQSALLATQISRLVGAPVCPDAIQRTRRTAPLDGHSRDQRFAALEGAIVAHVRRRSQIEGRHVCLVDDVMTSGATLAASTEALKAAGAAEVDVLVLARVAKDA